MCIFENTEQYDNNKVVNDKERLKSEGQFEFFFCFDGKKRQDRFFAVVFLCFLLSFSFGDHPFFLEFFSCGNT